MEGLLRRITSSALMTAACCVLLGIAALGFAGASVITLVSPTLTKTLAPLWLLGLVASLVSFVMLCGKADVSVLRGIAWTSGAVLAVSAGLCFIWSWAIAPLAIAVISLLVVWVAINLTPAHELEQRAAVEAERRERYSWVCSNCKAEFNFYSVNMKGPCPSCGARWE